MREKLTPFNKKKIKLYVCFFTYFSLTNILAIKKFFFVFFSHLFNGFQESLPSHPQTLEENHMFDFQSSVSSIA